jgi:hypothetical protein
MGGPIFMSTNEPIVTSQSNRCIWMHPSGRIRKIAFEKANPNFPQPLAGPEDARVFQRA